MKSASIKFLIVSTLFLGSACAEEIAKDEINARFPYVSLGLGPFPLPIPVFGAGYRAQWNHHGINGSVNVATLCVVTGVKGSLLYNYYFKPDLCSQFYFGVGPAVGVGFAKRSKTGFAFASEFVLGKQYRNESGDLRFFEATVDFPSFGIKKGHPRFFGFPIVVLNYGIGF